MSEEWLERTTKRMTPDQRERAIWLLRKEKKAARVKRPRGGQLKWSNQRLVVLLIRYDEARRNGASSCKAIRDLADEEKIGEKKLAAHLTEARKLLPLLYPPRKRLKPSHGGLT